MRHTDRINLVSPRETEAMSNSLLIIGVALLCLGASAAPTIGTDLVHSINCKDETKNEGPCTIKYKVCAEIHGLHFKYKTTATDEKSGKSAEAETSSSSGSAETATLALFNAMVISGNATVPHNATDPCNCATFVEKRTPTCTLLITGCAYFLSQSDLDAKPPKSAWKAWAYDNDTHYFGYADSGASRNLTLAVSNAVNNLSDQESLLKCF
eukprot:m.16924 g.16924  ORF g.16924 m.16924 type:complete len:211 (-) comp9148_c0_seq1:2677-3309(-)